MFAVVPEEYEIFGGRRVELVDLVQVLENRQVPVQYVDEDAFAGREHRAHRRIPGHLLRPRELIGHDFSSLGEKRNQNMSGRFRPYQEMGMACASPSPVMRQSCHQS